MYFTWMVPEISDRTNCFIIPSFLCIDLKIFLRGKIIVTLAKLITLRAYGTCPKSIIPPTILAASQ